MEYTQEFTYKIIVIGDVNVGKTSLIKKYVHDSFSDRYKSTIGVDFALKQIKVEDSKFNLQLWDIAGQERFGNMTRVYYRDAVGAIIVYDQTNPNSFDNIMKWKMDIDEKVSIANYSIPILLIGNKSDLNDNIFYDMTDYCKENGFIGYFSISAKTGLNIEEAMNYLVAEIRLFDKLFQNQESYNKVIDFELDNTTNKKNKNCFC